MPITEHFLRARRVSPREPAPEHAAPTVAPALTAADPIEVRLDKLAASVERLVNAFGVECERNLACREVTQSRIDWFNRRMRGAPQSTGMITHCSGSTRK